MNKLDIGDTTHRDALLRKCLDIGLPIDDIADITKPMRGKSNEEKEQLAKQALDKLLSS